MSPEIPEEFTKRMKVEDILSSLGFKKNQLGNLEQKWGELTFSATQWPKTSWVIEVKAGKLIIVDCKFRVSDTVTPIDLFAAFYMSWNKIFSEEAPPNDELTLGKQYLELKRSVQKLLPPMPTIWAEREFFRFCVSYIEKRHDWSKEDYEVVFSYQDGQLKFVVGSLSIFCPARGTWIGSAYVSGRQLFRRLPKRFLSDVVTICVEPDKIRIESRPIPARWQDAKLKNNHDS